MDFFDEVVENYNKIQFPAVYQDIVKIDKYIAYYLADATDKLISVVSTDTNKIIEIDIKSAFPNICENLFGKESDFVKQMWAATDKKSRNIFIATSLKGTEYLRKLNMICKMIIIGIIFDLAKNNDITLLELKKDGIIVSINEEVYHNLKLFIDQKDAQSCSFLDFIIKHNFTFHMEEYNRYIRFNKTSIMVERNGELQIKGKLKNYPKELRRIIKDLLNGAKVDLIPLKTIYSKRYFNILIRNNLSELLEKYYLCENQFLNEDINYVKYSRDMKINPDDYLRFFIFPIIISLKI